MAHHRMDLEVEARERYRAAFEQQQQWGEDSIPVGGSAGGASVSAGGSSATSGASGGTVMSGRSASAVKSGGGRAKSAKKSTKS